MSITKYFFISWLCIASAGCVVTKVATAPGSTVTDETFGRYQEDLEPDLIVITMTPERHALLTQMKPVPLGIELPVRYSEFLDGLNSKYGLKRVANWPLHTIDVFCVVFEVPRSDARESIVAALVQEPGEETAQIVQMFNAQTTSIAMSDTYNDPYLSMQHGVHSIQAISSHQGSRGAGVRIAIIDTGMDNTHPDLVSSSKATRNFVNNDDIEFRADTHGTAVGGIIAADADNNTGMVGIAPDATLLALKACWHILADKSQARFNSLTLAKALNYSIQDKVDVINLSLTGPPDPLLERLVLEALSQGIVVVGAKPAHEEKAFPVSVAGTIAVAMPSMESQSLSAPGRSVLSTRPNEDYDFFNGSSISTAHVSGLAALIRSLSSTFTPPDILKLIELTANSDTGEINACRAVALVRRLNGEAAGGGHCS